MAKIYFRPEILFTSLALLALGCDRGADPLSPAGVSTTNAVRSSASDIPPVKLEPARNPPPEEELSPDMVCLRKAQKALDDEDILKAMSLSRGLMDSEDPSIRAELVDIFRWVGKKAMPELAELMKDKDATVASAALDAWEFALQEINYDFAKVAAITNIASVSENPVVIDAVLMHIIDVESRYSLPALEGLVVGFRGKACGQCAKRMFEYIAGEPWASVERTKTILKEKGEIQ